MFGEKVEPVKYYRTEVFGLCSFLQLTRVDAALLTSVVEELDPDYAQYVGINQFAHHYCGEYFEAFLYLWRKVNIGRPVVKFDRSARGGVDFEAFANNGNEDNSDEDDNKKESVAEEEEYTPYHFIFGFLLLFLTIKDSELYKFIFWANYHLCDAPPDHQNLIDLMDALWPSADALKFKKNKMRILATKTLALATKDEFVPNKFNYYDIRAGAAWTRPVKALKKEIIEKTLGKKFWNKMSVSIQNTVENIDSAYYALTDPKGEMESAHFRQYIFILRGFRRETRKFLRGYVRRIKNYLSMPLDNDTIDLNAELEGVEASKSQPYSHSQAASSLFAKIFAKPLKLLRIGGRGRVGKPKKERSVYKEMKKTQEMKDPNNKKVKIAQHGTSGIAFDACGGGSASADIAYDEEDIDINAIKAKAIPLEVIFKESLTVPAKSLFFNSFQSQEAALNMLRMCDKSLLEICPSDFGASSEGGSSLASRPRASRAVVDVDSDEEEQDEEEDEEGSGEYSDEQSSNGRDSGEYEDGGDGGGSFGEESGNTYDDENQDEDVL